jgi:hypothetical protein
MAQEHTSENVIDSPPVRSRSSPALRAAALALFALFLAVSLPSAAVRAAKRLAQAAGLAGEDWSAARRRVFGAPWVEAVEAIRRTIPRDAPYLLVDATREEEGGAYWVRYELAPRPALFLGKVQDLPPPDRLARQLAGGPPWVVVALRDREPPLLFPREVFLRAMDRLHAAP